MNSISKRSVVVNGRKTSVSLEDAFWHALSEIARGQGRSVAQIVRDIDKDRRNHNRSSALRVYVLEHFRKPQADVIEAPAWTPQLARVC
jgi:predicted DNA-binding ribbon-helix-helix protein